MEFTPEKISSLENSLQFLINAMVKTGQCIVGNRLLESKPFWLAQTERFSSFYSRIQNNVEAVESFRQKVIAPIYETHNVNLLNRLVDDDGVVQDDFLKVPFQQSNDFRIKINPGGVYFQLDKLFLPISEVYTQAVDYSLKHKKENVPYPALILLGFYSTVYHAVKDNEPAESIEMLKKNIDILSDSMESCDQPVKRSQGPVDVLQNMLGNIDMGQIGEMMGKVTGDPKASKEFGEVFGKMTEVIKQGGNPLEAMGDIIKNASMRAGEESDSSREDMVISPVSEEAEKQE